MVDNKNIISNLYNSINNLAPSYKGITYKGVKNFRFTLATKL